MSVAGTQVVASWGVPQQESGLEAEVGLDPRHRSVDMVAPSSRARREALKTQESASFSSSSFPSSKVQGRKSMPTLGYLPALS